MPGLWIQFQKRSFLSSSQKQLIRLIINNTWNSAKNCTFKYYCMIQWEDLLENLYMISTNFRKIMMNIVLRFNCDIISNINCIIVAIVNFCSITHSTNILSEIYTHFKCMLFRLRGSCLKIREGIFLSIVCWISESYAIAQVLRAEVIRDLALECFQEKRKAFQNAYLFLLRSCKIVVQNLWCK